MLTVHQQPITLYGKLLLETKEEITPLLARDSEVLISCLESKGLLNKIQSEELLLIPDKQERIDELLQILTCKDASTYKSLITILEQNGEKVAARILTKAGRKNFPNDFTDIASDGQRFLGIAIIYF